MVSRPAPFARARDATVEDCVNAVGVELNTASVALLARVAGLNAALAPFMFYLFAQLKKGLDII